MTDPLRAALVAAADDIGAGPEGCEFAPLMDDETLRSDDLHHGEQFIDALLRDHRVRAVLAADTARPTGAPGGVHDHGPTSGPGIRCREYLIGNCRLAADTARPGLMEFVLRPGFADSRPSGPRTEKGHTLASSLRRRLPDADIDYDEWVRDIEVDAAGLALAAGTARPTYIEVRTSACHAGSDGDCSWADCPQLVEYRTSCPLLDTALTEDRPAPMPIHYRECGDRIPRGPCICSEIAERNKK